MHIAITKETDNSKFRDDVNNFVFDQFDVSNFKETLFNIFDKQAQIKQKYLRANETPFMTKEWYRQIMNMLRIHNNFLRTKSQEDIMNSEFFVENYWEKLKKYIL